MDYIKGGLNGTFWCLGGVPGQERSVYGCFSVVDIATSAIITEGAWVGGWKLELV